MGSCNSKPTVSPKSTISFKNAEFIKDKQGMGYYIVGITLTRNCDIHKCHTSSLNAK